MNNNIILVIIGLFLVLYLIIPSPPIPSSSFNETFKYNNTLSSPDQFAENYVDYSLTLLNKVGWFFYPSNPTVGLIIFGVITYFIIIPLSKFVKRWLQIRALRFMMQRGRR